LLFNGRIREDHRGVKMKILLAVDGSECSDLAVTGLSSRPWPKNSEVKILAVATSRIPNWYIDSSLALIAAHESEVEEQIIELSKLLPEVAGKIQSTEYGAELQVETEIIEGYPKEVIVEEAERWGADLIVLGSHGYGNLKRFFLGSVAQAVAAHAPCSVEIVRGKKSDAGED
jgi:nucleotide-binding universal stress UspA family protein